MRNFLKICITCGLLLGLSLNFGKAQVREVKFDQLNTYLNKQNDTLYIINFWATWCKPCVAELPHFKRIRKKFRSANVAMLLVSLDFTKNLDSKVRPFVKENNLKSQVLFLHQPRGDEWMNTISAKWSGAIPATLFIKNGGEERAFYEQKLSYDKLYSIVKDLK